MALHLPTPFSGTLQKTEGQTLLKTENLFALNPEQQCAEKASRCVSNCVLLCIECL